MPSRPNILIVGQSGAGKSNSLEQLIAKHGKRVALIDLEQKGFPFLFDHSKLGYYAEVADYNTALQELTKVKATSCDIVVYDSFTRYCEFAREHCLTKYTGYDIWRGYNNAIRKFIDFNKSMERLWICTGIDEVVYIEQAEGSRVSRLRLYVQGKEYEGKIENAFLIVVFCYTRKDKTGKVGHFFSPNTDTINSARSPQWLALPDQMPNDVSVIVDKLIEQKIV